MTKRLISLAVFSVSAMVLMGLSACQDSTGKKAEGKHQTMTVTKTATVSNLYYNGVIQPISTIVAVSPVSGYIASMHFDYGSPIKKGQLLVTINSEALSASFRSAVSDYLTSKQALSTQKLSFAGTQALFDAGIETRSNYLTSKSSYETAEMAFFQKKLALEKILRQVNLSKEDIESLSLSDTAAVNKILAKRFSHMPVYAEGSGIGLFPTQSSSADEGGSSTLNVGSSLKEGQVIVSIGDLSGFSVSFKVSEIDVNRLAPQIAVTVTGASFPNIVLQGYIESVAAQADASQGGNTAQFNVKVVVPHITDTQRKLIHIGMTSKVDIHIQNPPAILVPISAVVQNNGQSAVIVVDKEGKQKAVPVQTGQTNQSSVTILNGLTVGEEIVVPEAAP